MGDDDQVKDIVERSKSYFLRETLSREMQREGYQLDQEFAKTKKNKSLIVIISIILFVLIFSSGAILVTLYIQRETKRVPVSIEAFADVNLKEVLDRAKKYENQMEIAKRDLEDINQSMEQEIAEVEQQADYEIELINTRNYSQAETNRRIRAVRNDAEEKIAEIREQYQGRIEEKQTEIADIQVKMDAYDAKMVEQAKKQEEILNDQQRRFEIQMQETVTYYEQRLSEMKRQWEEEVSGLTTHYESMVTQLKSNYENRISTLKRNHEQEVTTLNQQHADEVASLKQAHANEVATLKRQHANELAQLKQQHADEIDRLILKYNPVFDSGEMASLLAASIRAEELGAIPLGSYQEILKSEGILELATFNSIHSNLREAQTILNTLQTVPYENSIPKALRHLESRSRKVVRSYDRLWQSMAEVLRDKNYTIAVKSEQVDNFLYALEALVKNSRENGYVLDPRDSQGIIVFIDKIHNVKPGDIGYVFRHDNEVIGTIRFYEDSGSLYARQVALESEDNPIRPFDKILIQVK